MNYKHLSHIQMSLALRENLLNDQIRLKNMSFPMKTIVVTVVPSISWMHPIGPHNILHVHEG